MADRLDEVLAGLVEVDGPVRPGDVLIFRVNASSVKQLDHIADDVKAALNERAPDVGAIFVAGAEQILVYRPEH